jgi:protein required for attachment to host cells
LRDSALGSDRPGRSHDSGHPGAGTLATEEKPHERITAGFVRQLASIVERGRRERAFHHLMLVAEPRFLGLLRAALSTQTQALITSTITSDLGGFSDDDVIHRIVELIDESPLERGAIEL